MEPVLFVISADALFTIGITMLVAGVFGPLPHIVCVKQMAGDRPQQAEGHFIVVLDDVKKLLLADTQTNNIS